MARLLVRQAHAQKNVRQAHLIVWGGNLAYLVLPAFAKTNVLNYGIERTALSKPIKLLAWVYRSNEFGEV